MLSPDGQSLDHMTKGFVEVMGLFRAQMPTKRMLDRAGVYRPHLSADHLAGLGDVDDLPTSVVETGAAFEIAGGLHAIEEPRQVVLGEKHRVLQLKRSNAERPSPFDLEENVVPDQRRQSRVLEGPLDGSECELLGPQQARPRPDDGFGWFLVHVSQSTASCSCIKFTRIAFDLSMRVH